MSRAGTQRKSEKPFTTKNAKDAKEKRKALLTWRMSRIRAVLCWEKQKPFLPQRNAEGRRGKAKGPFTTKSTKEKQPLCYMDGQDGQDKSGPLLGKAKASLTADAEAQRKAKPRKTRRPLSPQRKTEGRRGKASLNMDGQDGQDKNGQVGRATWSSPLSHIPTGCAGCSRGSAEKDESPFSPQRKTEGRRGKHPLTWMDRIDRIKALPARSRYSRARDDVREPR